MYYVRDLTQGEIADALSLSKPTVIAYLKLARERNIVCFRLAPEHHQINALADALKARWGLTSVHVVPVQGTDDMATTRAVCEVAAYHLPNLLQPGDVLGVSWGQTISFVSEMIPDWPIPDLTVRQLLGSLANPLLSTCESCSTEIARRLGAYCINFNAPAVCSSASLAAAVRSEPIIAEQLTMLRACNKAIYSLSPCTPDTHVVQFKIATPDDIEGYRRLGAVGIIAGRFIDAEGRPVLSSLDERLIGCDHELLRSMEGLLVVSGVFKADAARAALKGGFVNHLVTDTDLASALAAE